MALPVVVLLFGGPSEEYEVSLRSAAHMLRCLDRTRYRVLPVGITRFGGWFRCAPDPDMICRDEWFCQCERNIPVYARRGQLICSDAPDRPLHPRAVLPALHGAYGEDGRLQGMLDCLALPYVGSGPEASALCMNKALTKSRLRAAGLPVLDWLEVTPSDMDDPEALFCRVNDTLSFPVFVKPCRGGSSIGACPVRDGHNLLHALSEALLHDDRALVEPLTDAQECEVAVFCDGKQTLVSRPGMIDCAADFYHYRAKYSDPDTRTVVPAPLSGEVSERMRQLARAAFDLLGCRHLARMDFFVRRSDGEVFLNEVNTLPGMTERSLYPALMADSGLPFCDCLTRLIEAAV